jgi:general secretion pathway protein J
MAAESVRRSRGFTLVELLVAIAIMAGISALIYGAFAGMRHTREGLERLQDRYREGRLAMARMTRELQSAYISMHVPINPAFQTQKTAFIGSTGTPADRIDFDSFSNRRIERNSHVSDQCELSFFGQTSTVDSGATDLVRRVSTKLDLNPKKGGHIESLATDIDLFDLHYLDPLTGSWLETWDTTQSITGQPARLPVQVKILLVLNGGARGGSGRGRDTIRLITRVPIPIENALAFAVMQ